jgi:L-lactate utilization protein LutB
MDNNLKWVNECRINRTIEALKKNNMNGYLAKDKEEIINIIENLIDKGDVVSCGGSMSLFETGIIEYLRSGKYEFLDRYKEGLSGEDIGKIYRDSFFADAYFTSSNAITEEGELYNVDGNGNRVAAMLFGPKKVIVVVGVNKIVKDIDEAIKRNREIAAPANAKRLNRATPCAKVGHCMDCNSNERICNEYTIIKRQGNKDRIHVIFLNEELGY